MAKGLRSKRMQRNKRHLRASVMNQIDDTRTKELSTKLLSSTQHLELQSKMDVVSGPSVLRPPKKSTINNTRKILKSWNSKRDHRWLPVLMRGGARGGHDQFSWDSVKEDRNRICYLGNSIKAPVGRWQMGKDIAWFQKSKEARTDLPLQSSLSIAASSLKEEQRILQEKEKEMMTNALLYGFGGSSTMPSTLPPQIVQSTVELFQGPKPENGLSPQRKPSGFVRDTRETSYHSDYTKNSHMSERRRHRNDVTGRLDEQHRYDKRRSERRVGTHRDRDRRSRYSRSRNREFDEYSGSKSNSRSY